jgi:hypothetical protein
VSAPTGPARRWIFVRTSPGENEERTVLAEVVRRLTADGIEVVVALIGSAAYSVEREEAPPPGSHVHYWVLEDDARGRGLRLAPSGGVRIVSTDEFVEGLMASERVVQFP